MSCFIYTENSYLVINNSCLTIWLTIFQLSCYGFEIASEKKVKELIKVL